MSKNNDGLYTIQDFGAWWIHIFFGKPGILMDDQRVKVSTEKKQQEDYVRSQPQEQ